jgi:hypothetical protein
MLTDPRRFSRTIAAVALILGPIVVLAGMLATPWEDEATTASYHDALAAHPGQAPGHAAGPARHRLLRPRAG